MNKDNNIFKNLKSTFDKKGNVKRTKENSTILPKILSVLAAILLWLYVFQAVEYEKELKNIPVTFENFDSSLGLDIVSGYENTIDVTISGTKSIINAIGADDIRASVDLSEVNQIGSYDLEINLQIQGSANIQSQSISQISLYVDKIIEKQIKVEPFVNYNIQNPYSLGEISVSPEYVTVRGPETDIVNIEKALISSDLGTVENSIHSNSSIILVDKNNKEIDARFINIQPSVGQLNIDVYKTTLFTVQPDFVVNNEFEYSYMPSKLYLKGFVNDIDVVSALYTERFIIEAEGEYRVMLKLPEGIKAYTSYDCKDTSECDSILLKVTKKINESEQ